MIVLKKNIKILVFCILIILTLAPVAHAYWTDKVNSYIDISLSYNTTLNVLNIPVPPPIVAPIPEVPAVKEVVPQADSLSEIPNSMETDVLGTDAEGIEGEPNDNDTNSGIENTDVETLGESDSNIGSEDTDTSGETYSSGTCIDSGTNNSGAESEE